MRDKINLVSTGKRKDGKLTGYRRPTKKNKKTSTEKIKIKKFDPYAYNPDTGKYGMHVIFEEGKI